MSAVEAKTYEIEFGTSHGSRGSFSVQVELDPSLDEPLAAQLRRGLLSGVCEYVKDNGYHERFYVDRSHGLDDPSFHEIALAAIKQGIIEHAARGADESDVSLESYVSGALESELEKSGMFPDDSWQAACDTLGSTNDWMIQLVEIAHAHGFSIDEAAEEHESFKTELLAATADTLADLDDSKCIDLLRHTGAIRMVFAPKAETQYWDDCMVECSTNYGSASHALPGDGMKAFLELINMSVADYADAVKEFHGVDLMESDEWQAFANQVAIEPKRLPAIAKEKVIEVMDNMNGYGNAALVVAIEPSTLMQMVPGKSLIVDGGQVGIHNFFNGSGHLIDPSKPIVVPADIAQWKAESGDDKIGRYSVDSVYGMVSSAYKATIRVVDAPEPSRERALATAPAL